MGRARIATVTRWLAAGGVAGVGLFGALAAASSAASKTSTESPVTTVSEPGALPAGSTDDQDDPLGTVPATVPSEESPDTAAPIVQPPAQVPSSGGRHHADATSGGS